MIEEVLEELLRDPAETPETIKAAKAYLERLNSQVVPSDFNIDELLQMEFKLLKMVQKGIEAQRALNNDNAVMRDMLELQRRHGDEARQQLVASDQRYIASIAKRYIGKGLSFVELLYYGNQGLNNYIERYELAWGLQPNLKSGFVRKAISNAIISQPPTLKQLIAVRKQLQLELARKPTDEEVALEMGIINIEDAVKIYTSWQAGSDLEPAVEQNLKDAVNKIKYLNQLNNNLVECCEN